MNSGMSQVKPDLLLFFALTFSTLNFNINFSTPHTTQILKFKFLLTPTRT